MRRADAYGAAMRTRKRRVPGALSPSAAGFHVKETLPLSRMGSTVCSVPVAVPSESTSSNATCAVPVTERAEPSAAIKARVDAARAIQTARFGPDGPECNSHMGPKELAEFCVLDKEGTALIERAFARMGLTARSYDRILRVARTIADLDGMEHIAMEHVAEAIQYRESAQLRR